MDCENFKELVKRMRLVQIDFFSGNKSVIEKSKELEKMVDEELGIRERQPKEQLKLF